MEINVGKIQKGYEVALNISRGASMCSPLIRLTGTFIENSGYIEFGQLVQEFGRVSQSLVLLPLIDLAGIAIAANPVLRKLAVNEVYRFINTTFQTKIPIEDTGPYTPSKETSRQRLKGVFLNLAAAAGAMLSSSFG